MGAAEAASIAGFHAVADDAAAAMLAARRQGVNCAFEAVEGVLSTGHHDLETLVIFISTDFTLSHG